MIRSGGPTSVEDCEAGLAENYEFYACCDTDLCNMATEQKAFTSAIVLLVVAIIKLA